MDRPPHLDIDLNEAPSPPPFEPPQEQAPLPPPEPAPPAYAVPPPPLPPQPQPPQPQLPPPAALLPLVAPSQQQVRLQQEALEVVLRFHRPPELRNTPFGPIGGVPAGLLPAGLGLPAPHPGEAGWGFPPPPCASCSRQEELGSTFVCDACDRGFHSKCVRVWPPLLPPPPPPGPPGARRPRAAANEDWICPECEMRGARSTRWKLGPVPLDINAAPPEEPVAVPAPDISRQFLELLIAYIDICLTIELLRSYE
ncbi:unnamed protein product [Urochloa humidicola]